MKWSNYISRRNLFGAFATLAVGRDSAGTTPTTSEGRLPARSVRDPSRGDVMSTDETDDVNGIPRGRVRHFPAHTQIASARIDNSVTHLRTAGYSAEGDGGGALYRRAADPPRHAGRAQSADGTWWELVPQNGKVSAEQFGAVNQGAADDHGALTDAIAYAAMTNATLVARGTYRIDSTLVFMGSKYGFEGPPLRSNEAFPEAGFIWGGGNDDVMVELQELEQVHVTNLSVSNRVNQATGITGILAHNSVRGGASITNLHFDFIGIYGCHIGLQIGDATNDGYNSNWEQNVIENIHFWEVANPLIVDSDHIDNLIFKTFHAGGPQSPLPAYIGTRKHVIWIKAAGHGHYFDYIFARADDIVADNAIVRVDDGTFSCGFCNFEGNVSARLLDITTVLSRSQNVIRQMTGIDAQVDRSGRSMHISSGAGVTLIGCGVGGDIECDSQVTAINTIFRRGSGFTGSALAELVQINTQFRAAQGSELMRRAGRIGHGAIPVRREASFNSGAINSRISDVVSESLDAGSMAVWQVAQQTTSGLNGIWRIYIWRTAAGRLSYHVEEILDKSDSTEISVIIRGSTYTINIANDGDFDAYYSGWLETHNRFMI